MGSRLTSGTGELVNQLTEMASAPRVRNSERRALADKRTRIVDTAAMLVHEHGFANTTLADIARESGVPLGNIYYYFKSKEAIGEALVEKRAGAHAVTFATWDAELEPRARLDAFIQATIESRDVVARSGCPIGTLCSELHKDGGPLAERAATLFDALLTWLEAQFEAMGKGAESRGLAFHLLSAVQGASLLANTFDDTRQLTRECNRLKDWVRSL